MWTFLLKSLFVTALLTGCHGYGQPRVQLRGTTLVGKFLQPSKMEFFGGYYCSLILTRQAPYHSLSGIPFAEPPVDGLRFSPPQPKYSLSPPLQSFDARSFGSPCLQPVSPPNFSSVREPILLTHSNGFPICQRTVSLLTYSGLPVLTLTRLCLSWSGFTEADSNVRGGHLNISVNSRRFADGASSLYDGTPLVEYSVTRVWMSSHSHMVPTRLVIDFTHRERRSCLYLSTIVLDPSASL